MTLRELNRASHPDFPWLSPGDVAAVESLLSRLHWRRSGERVQSCDPAGEGNMNLVLRVVTDQRSLILKQARPWVEKYDHIAAPWDRILVEQRFYERVASIHAVAIRMPRVIASDATSRVLLLEDLGEASDFTYLYRGKLIDEDYLRKLATYLRRLHDVTAHDTPDPILRNREMRDLNHVHLFEVPLDPRNGIDLDKYELWLGQHAAELRADADFRQSVAKLGERYLQDGHSLLHGDFFPGSWLRVGEEVKVIDPEFAFYGDPEFDLGVAIAHLRLAAQNFDYGKLFLAAYTGRNMEPNFDLELVARYAAVEVMRRILGVAQLPIPSTEGFRACLLGAARDAMHDRSVEALWA